MINRGKACLHCGSLQHSSFQCFSKPRKPMQNNGFRTHCIVCDSLTHTKAQCPERIPKIKSHVIDEKTGRYPDLKLYKTGKYGEKWLATRKQWMRLNPPDHANNYYCHYCRVAMAPNEMTLDHKESRTRHPELRFELSNLVPCCGPDNTAKGSKSHDEYCKMCVISQADVLQT